MIGTPVNDPALINPWGITSVGDNLWIALNGSSAIRAYNINTGAINSALIPVNSVTVGEQNDPTGIVADLHGQFLIPGSGSAFIIVGTEQGTINAWNNSLTNAVVVVSTPNGNYKGVAKVDSRHGSRLYAANFEQTVSNGSVDVFDSNFNKILIGKFVDPRPLPGFAPFNVANIDGCIYVLYAEHNPADPIDNLNSPGAGYISVFTQDGEFVRKFYSGVPLNAPWGIVSHHNKIYVGNFGDGTINVFSREGKFLRALQNCTRQAIVIHGLWGLLLHQSRIYFASGPNDEANGLVGYLAKSCQ